MPEAVARTLSQALARLLDAAEAASHAHLTSLQITRPPADNDRLVLEWLSDGPDAAVSELPADASKGALAAEASDAYGEHAAAIAAAIAAAHAALAACGMWGRIRLQTFGDD